MVKVPVPKAEFVARVPGAPMPNVPAFSVTPPENVLLPSSDSFPVPALMRLVAVVPFEMTPWIVEARDGDPVAVTVRLVPLAVPRLIVPFKMIFLIEKSALTIVGYAARLTVALGPLIIEPPLMVSVLVTAPSAAEESASSVPPLSVTPPVNVFVPESVTPFVIKIATLPLPSPIMPLTVVNPPAPPNVSNCVPAPEVMLPEILVPFRIVKGWLIVTFPVIFPMAGSEYVPLVRKFPTVIFLATVPNWGPLSAGLPLKFVVDASPKTIVLEFPTVLFPLAPTLAVMKRVPLEMVVMPVYVFAVSTINVPAEPVPVFSVRPAVPASMVVWSVAIMPVATFIFPVVRVKSPPSNVYEPFIVSEFATAPEGMAGKLVAPLLNTTSSVEIGARFWLQFDAVAQTLVVPCHVFVVEACAWLKTIKKTVIKTNRSVMCYPLIRDVCLSMIFPACRIDRKEEISEAVCRNQF